jgi:Tol biopolymer transport system component
MNAWNRYRALASACLALLLSLARSSTSLGAEPAARDAGTEQLAREVAVRGWIVFSSKTPNGDYDLFAARPDGSALRNLTHTPDSSEYGARLSPSGKKLLYRRVKKGESLNHDVWGALGVLVMANPDGSQPVVQGQEGEWPWASWGADDKLVACLHKREGVIRIYEWETKRVVKELPRQGIFQQLFWSPDGQRLCGTANINGQNWNVVSLELATGKSTLLTRELNCTADWFQKDRDRVVYCNRTPGLATDYGWTMIMQATADGKSRSLVYGERGRHVYYGCMSPDDQYVLFSRPESDGGTDATMAIIRLADAPIIVPDDYKELKALYPQSKGGPVLHLPHAGFEPQWVAADLGAR